MKLSRPAAHKHVMNKAQAISEYVLILFIVALALGAMKIYFQRGINAAVRLVADDIGSQEQAVQIINPRIITTSRSEIRSQKSDTTTTSIQDTDSGKERMVSIDSTDQVVPLGEDRPSQSIQITEEDK